MKKTRILESVSMLRTFLVIFLGPGTGGEGCAVVQRICFKFLFVSLLVPLHKFLCCTIWLIIFLYLSLS